MTVLGDATVSFDFPTNSIGSVSPPRRELKELPEFPEHKPRRRHHKKEKNKINKIVEEASPSPISDFFFENRVELGASTFTFVFVLYVAHKLGLFFTQTTPQSILTSPPRAQ